MIIDPTTPPSSGDPKGAPLAPVTQRDSVVIESVHLFADHKEVQIRHRGEIYRLRLTRNGKLILNK